MTGGEVATSDGQSYAKCRRRMQQHRQNYICRWPAAPVDPVAFPIEKNRRNRHLLAAPRPKLGPCP
jgi:hypothetical protein